jgi:hypothetical protein
MAQSVRAFDGGLSLSRQEPWFAAFLLAESRQYRSRGIREIQAGAWAVGTLLDSAGDVVTPSTVGDASWVLLAPFFDEQRAPALLIMRDAEVNDWYIQYGVLNHGAVNEALRVNSRIIVRAGPAQFGIEARDVTVSPAVGGQGDVQAALEYVNDNMLSTAGATMTGPLHVREVDAATERTEAVNRGYVDSLVLGVSNFIGRLDAENDEVYYTQISGITPSPGPLCTPEIARQGGMVICERPGIMPPGSQMEGTVFSYGDRAISDGDVWYHFPSVTEQVTGTMVALTPEVFARDNVQAALQMAEAAVNNRVQKSGDTITGMLTLDPGVPGLPALFIRQPANDPGATFLIAGNPNGRAIDASGSIRLTTGDLEVMGGASNVSSGAGFVIARQFYLGVEINCGYLLGNDTTSGGLWRNNNGQMTLRRPAGQADLFSEDNNAVSRQRILTENDLTDMLVMYRAPALFSTPAGLPLDQNWKQWWIDSFSLPGRTGSSRLLISLSVSCFGPTGQIWLLGARLAAPPGGAVERRVFMYADGMTGLFEFYVDVLGANPTLAIQLAAFGVPDANSPPPGIETRDARAYDTRSEISIIDLGPSA